MADFNWNIDSDNGSTAADVSASPPAATSRRARRAQETVASAARVRRIMAPRSLTPSRPSPTKMSRAARVKSARVKSVPARSVPARSVPVKAARSTAPRRAQLLRKFITISAMFGAGALLVATSLPAVALQMNSASALTSELRSTSNSEVQSLAVDSSAASAALARDLYTVVNTTQQARLKSGLQDFLYTNDTNGTIQWPFPAPVPISSGFGSRQAPCGGCSSFHEGVDFIPGSGTPIDAIANGTVTYAAYDSSFGYHVIVDHNINGQKVQSLYAHMIAGSIKVVVGQQVTVTQELGQVGNTGHSTGAHLHLEVHLDGTPVDPFAWLKANAN